MRKTTYTTIYISTGGEGVRCCILLVFSSARQYYDHNDHPQYNPHFPAPLQYTAADAVAAAIAAAAFFFFYSKVF